jgi:hypothetical protein
VSNARRAVIAAAAVCACLTPAAEAHLVSTDLGPFYDGVAHALVTPLDVLTVLAVAAIAGLGGPGPGRASLLALVAGWGVGAPGGYLAGAAPAGLAVFGPLALIALGVGGASNARMDREPMAVIALLLGLSRGAIAGADAAAAGLGWKHLLGYGCSTAVLAALLLAGGVWLGARPARIGVRVLASWIGALGLLLIGWQLRGVGSF